MNHLLNIFRQTCFNRHFELKVAELHKQGKIKIPIYLSCGTEHIVASILEANKDFIVFPSHRCHSHYLSCGGDPLALMKELLGHKDGCNGGMGGSASISVPRKMYGHDGLLGSNLPLASGFAYASQKPTLVVLGDGAVEEDYCLAALGQIATNKSPVLIVVEDNDLSILTPTSKRRTWNIVDVARGFGLEARYIDDKPETIYDAVRNIELPALLNINVCRHLFHCGSGQDSLPEWDTYSEFKERLGDVSVIEEEVKNNLDLQYLLSL